MGRKASVGAADWALVLSELAEVEVMLEWERPAWRVRWTDGPTVAMLAERAEALSRYRVGEPVTFERMRFDRDVSSVAWALAWLDTGGSPGGNVSATLGDVETALAGTPYPLARPAEAITAARLLSTLAGQDEHRMGRLLAESRGTVPSLPPAESVLTGLPGRVVGVSWLRGGPPPELLAAAPDARHETRHETRGCARCGNPVPARRTGRPALYCGDACRAAAFRARQAQSQT